MVPELTELFSLRSSVARAVVQLVSDCRMTHGLSSIDSCCSLQSLALPKQRRSALRATVHREYLHPVRCVARNVTSDVVVIGAGAAGLTAAYFAAQRGATKVLHTYDPSNKQM